jgi:putative glutathione S-transferase
MKMLNTEFEMFAEKKVDLYPVHLQSQIEENYDWIYNTINNGVYKAGFAVTQEAYNEASTNLFKSLDRAEKMLEGRQYLIGNQFTLMDVRLFMTLIRFDPVYIVHFKCNKRSIESYPNLNRFVRHLYHDYGLKKVINMNHITRHYYGSHPQLNHKGIVPIGPEPWWEELPFGQVPVKDNLKEFLIEVAIGEKDLEIAR